MRSSESGARASRLQVAEAALGYWGSCTHSAETWENRQECQLKEKAGASGGERVDVDNVATGKQLCKAPREDRDVSSPASNATIERVEHPNLLMVPAPYKLAQGQYENIRKADSAASCPHRNRLCVVLT